MAVDLVLDLEGVPGECKKKGYEGKIDIEAVSWGGSRSGTFHVGGGGAGGQASVSDVSISKHYDKASPLLQQCCLTGKHIATGKIVFRKSGETPQEYLVCKLTDIIVTSFNIGGSQGSDGISEQVSFNFAKVEFNYQEQTEKGGLTAGGDLKFDVPAGVTF